MKRSTVHTLRPARVAARRSGPRLAATVIAALLLVCATTNAAADGPWRTANVMSADGRAPLSDRVAELTWLTGHWVGEGLGGSAEYVYGPYSAGTIAGIFQHARDDEVTFYELIVIGEFDGRTALRLKHFHPDLTGWEAADEWLEFPLLAIEAERAAYFDGLTYRVADDGALEAYVIAQAGDSGEQRELAFRFRRAGHGAR